MPSRRQRAIACFGPETSRGLARCLISRLVARCFTIGLAACLWAHPVQSQGSAADHMSDLLQRACQSTPSNTEAFCTCLARRAIAELKPAALEHLLIVLTYPSILDFERPMPPERLSTFDEQVIGPFQRSAVPACRASVR